MAADNDEDSVCICSAAKLSPCVILTRLMLLVLSHFSHAAASVETSACLQGIVYVCGLDVWSVCVTLVCRYWMCPVSCLSCAENCR